jgi:catechol 2,3-dioxygenase-like lactoylglutathione lyase family enzyme
MGSGIAGIDHVILAVRDLDRARQGWTRLGFTLTPRGRHLGAGTGNYCVMFAGDYIELLGVVDARGDVGRIARLIERGEGLAAAAFAPEGTLEAARAALIERGLNPGEVRALARQLEAPEGTLLPRFSLCDLAPEETPGLDCFLCVHLTPELLRRPPWQLHPNGAVAVRGLHVLVADTAPLLAAYDRLFGLHEVTTTDAVASVRIGAHRILFSTPDDFLTMHPGIEIEAEFPVPGILALELAVASTSETADYLARWQIPFDEMQDGTLAVPPAAANGALLLFSQDASRPG